MVKILHCLKDPGLWELWHIPYDGYCRILTISRMGSFISTIITIMTIIIITRAIGSFNGYLKGLVFLELRVLGFRV